jgi:hypothetical protein
MTNDTATPDQRIAALEDVLKEKERRLLELKAGLDKANDLVERMREPVQDCGEAIEAWKEAFDVELTDSGWAWAKWVVGAHGKRVALLREWNHFVPEYNAAARPPRNVGRPLAESDAQRETVLKLRKHNLANPLVVRMSASRKAAALGRVWTSAAP